ncbi:MAG: hypothetical protein J3Q66DRAFT_40254 [Benniella sp.]|nr:MAG: hypothetical protein J3Q66DRAFT_40254 [Benniella sp.]
MLRFYEYKNTAQCHHSFFFMKEKTTTTTQLCFSVDKPVRRALQQLFPHLVKVKVKGRVVGGAMAQLLTILRIPYLLSQHHLPAPNLSDRSGLIVYTVIASSFYKCSAYCLLST